MPGFEIFGEEERKEVADVLESGVLFRYGFDQARRGHWKARTFEEELAGKLGTGYCHLCSSGTAALSIALAACGIGARDEVIVPAFTFIATIESVLWAGAVPVFAEIDDTLCLDPQSVEACIGPRTRAVLPVHMCGAMAQIDRIEKLCRSRDLLLIEDTAQALGASYQGRALGTFGHMGCFSFDAVKTITCGEGGAVVTRDPELYARAHQFADHGHDHVGSDRGREGHPTLGTNFRISELNAAVGLAQLRKLDAIVQTQRNHKKVFKQALSRFSEVGFRRLPDPEGDSATFLTFFMPDPERAREVTRELGRAGVDGCFYWFDNNWHYHRRWEHFKSLKGPARLPQALWEEVPDYRSLALPRSDAILMRTVSMQVKLGWTQEHMETRIAAMEKVFGG